MTDTASNRPLRVFLCHASGDKPAVRDLYRRLAADGFSPWLDQEDLLPGQKWQVEIPKAVRNSDVVLVCLSQHSINKEGYVQKEIKFALDVADEKPEGTIFLIPLRLEECDVPERLSAWQWVNFYEDDGYTRLVRALRQRAADLPAAAPAGVKSASPARTSTINHVSGGVNVEASNVNVGKDVVGRDKVTQTTINIERATFIQSGASVQEIKPTVPAALKNRRVIGGMEFVRVPAGQFIMGSNQHDDEKPQHTVEIPSDYWIGKYPVTNEQFARFVTATTYKFAQGDWKKKTDHPVVNVSWHDALAYCKWLNDALRGELNDLTLRLPTEAEWEKAARGAQGNEYPWGNDWDPRKCNSEGSGTKPVGAYSPQGNSPYGAADMVGNVWEWCHSLYKPYPYQATDGRERESGDSARVLRGGSWYGDRDVARCACRRDLRPGYGAAYGGFRCVVSPGSRS